MFMAAVDFLDSRAVPEYISELFGISLLIFQVVRVEIRVL